MAILTGTVTTGDHDWDSSGSGGTTMLAQWADSPPIDNKAYAKVTADISGGTLTAATIYWNQQDYTKSPRAETTYRGIQTASGESASYDTMWTNTNDATVEDGWTGTQKITNSTKLTYFNVDGGETFVLFTVGTGGASGTRNWYIYTYNNLPGDAPYIVFEYEPYVPSTRRRRLIIT